MELIWFKTEYFKISQISLKLDAFEQPSAIYLGIRRYMKVIYIGLCAHKCKHVES